ncbi:MAG: DNA-formamidopyrimidine glycosylase family protein [Herminiimonas sp.]|uniref:DNA-formamidopyrimidine glycosylase family protein n=1 Tax=Herminiimonas sp. TaxID=1926289 RepID=UPI002717C6FA|nr:DNA-formamidopyrimidine glycosylase family protein [Herminiimonas sp.]MDO9420864.1 DNA-formamidopyrimidine glycosylase family protein [Herminiimonas sp.]
MPEGPTMIILKEEAGTFKGKTILHASGNSKIEKSQLVGQRIVALRTWGKHFLIQLPKLTIRIHLLMFGSYRINQRKDAEPRLSLKFKNDELNFYTCSVQLIEEELDQHYDWGSDVMSDQWNAAAARKKLRARPDMLVSDALLDQTIFSGVGNIIKNEVLFRIRIHPLSTIGGLPAPKLRALVEQAREYAFDVLKWKRAFVLKQHWLAHTKLICPRCNIPFSKVHLGKTKRRSFYCERCQRKYLHQASLHFD